MSESNDKQNEQKSDETSSGPQSNTIWGSAFVRLSLYILLGFILLATSRYVYLKVTDQYPANFEEQSIIQYPHLEQLQSNQKKRDANTSTNKNAADASTSEEEGATDSLSQDGGRRE